MSVKSNIKLKIYSYLNRQEEKRYEQNIKGKIAQCNPVPLTKLQVDEIQSFWKPILGREVTTLWHQYFTARNGKFSPLYVPSSIYHSEIIYRLNFHPFRNSYVDKGFYDLLFASVNKPKTIVKNMNGYFYDGQGKPLSKDEAVQICYNLPSAVIKPSHEGMWGEGVRVFSVNNGNSTIEGKTIGGLFSQYNANFIVQEKIEQHEGIANLNPDSVNTLRVLTYRRENEVVVLYTVVRIGRLGKTVDNETAGGINADIDLNTGKIIECAYGTPAEKKIYKTDNGTELANYQIPSFDKVLGKAKQLHLTLPYFNMIGWDFTVDKNGEPILIEFNRCPDLSQTAHGPAFGEYTEEILHVALERPNTRVYNL